MLTHRGSHWAWQVFTAPVKYYLCVNRPAMHRSSLHSFLRAINNCCNMHRSVGKRNESMLHGDRGGEGTTPVTTACPEAGK